jgi:hypothetical protein
MNSGSIDDEASMRRLTSPVAWSAAAIILAVMGTSIVLLRPHPSPPAPIRITVETPEGGSLPLFGRPAVSPDGQSVLFAVALADDRRTVWYLHNIATETNTKLNESEGISGMFWSYDGRAALLNRSGSLWRMDLPSGTRQRLPVAGAYSSWQKEGIVTGGQRGIRWISIDGATERWIKKRDDDNGIVYSYPSLIPGGKWLIYNAESSRDDSKPVSVRIASLDGKVDREIRLAEHPTVYAQPGYLLSLRGDTLTAQAIDPEKGVLLSDMMPVAGPVGSSDREADRLGAFSSSGNGVLVYRNAGLPGGAQTANGFTVIQNWPSLLTK